MQKKSPVGQAAHTESVVALQDQKKVPVLHCRASGVWQVEHTDPARGLNVKLLHGEQMDWVPFAVVPGSHALHS